MGSKLKNALGKCKSFPKKLQRVIDAEKLKRKKNKIIKHRDYVEAIHICRQMGDYEKDEFLLEFLDSQPSSALFVLGIATSNMDSYFQANQLLQEEYDWNEYALDEAAHKNLDDNLCSYLDKYNSEDDCRYVLQLTDYMPWFKSHMKAQQLLM